MAQEMKMDKAVTCAFTGHRPGSLPWREDENDPRCLALKKRLDQAVERAYHKGFRHFICGMAKGADAYFCEAVIRLRAVHGDVRLEAAVPFPGQSDRWSRADRERYQRLLSQCDFETLIQQAHSPGCMHRRNRYMVDHAGLVIAVFNGQPQGSGTLATLNYAILQGAQTDIIYLDQLEEKKEESRGPLGN